MTSSSRFTDPAFELVLAGQRSLTVGANEPATLALQTALADMGFALPGGPDGSFGAQTKKAVANFQQHAATFLPDVTPTGQLDALTLRALDATAPPPGGRGQRWNLPNPIYDGRPVQVVVAKAEHRTFLFDKGGALTGIFPNAVGSKHNATDEGLKVVRTKLGEREARNTGSKLYGQPLVFGPRILDLQWADGKDSGEELHGTSAPQALGEDVSHGCVRHHNDDIIVIYDALAKGDLVAIVGRIDDRRLGPPFRP